MNVLGVETSCDETAAAVVIDGHEVRASVISSQVAQHAGYGGVVPELAAREHLRAIDPVVSLALARAGATAADIEAVAVTHCPGLVPALLVGVAYGQGLATARALPYVATNHFLAHVYGALLERQDVIASRLTFPLLALVVSGGHTALLLIRHDGSARIVGRTLDDAAGEAFDKAAKILDLGYPGGPVIDRLARQGDPGRLRFPRGLTGTTGRAARREDLLNFSFSGIKTALFYHVRDRRISEPELVDIVASYQAAIVEVLVQKTLLAAEVEAASSLVVCGGVACNSALRAEMAAAAAARGLRLVIAPPKYCTDNAAMVAGLAYHYLRCGQTAGFEAAVAARLADDLGTIPFAPEARLGSRA